MTRLPHRTTARHLASLVKPRIVALLSLTGASALVAAGGASAPTTLAFLVAGALVAAGAAALNCYYDRDLDRHMERTAGRPLPRGDLDPRVALGFAVGLLVAGTAVGLAALRPVAVGYMWLGVAAYVGVYTVGLKRRHWLGVVLGGSAGSFPVLAGWTAVRPLEPASLLLAALVFAWTPAHAWALAYVYRDDFAAADIPTLPAVADGATVRRAVWYSALATVGVVAATAAVASTPFAVAAAVATPPFLLAFDAFRRRGTEATAVLAFFTSNTYLAVLFVAWAAGAHVGAYGPAGAAVTVALVAAAYAWLWVARPSLRGVAAASPPSLVDDATRRARRVGAAVGRWTR